MESDKGKLFVGGISWDTNEERLRDYFAKFGEVVEAVIMKDRITGRARGFGFVVFADPSVAEHVVLEKHIIDGRVVEAKKAVPRDDLQMLHRISSGSLTGSPSPSRSKKIFVGGLASTVTENDFRKYFEQFGTITDVVVMYDHNTQRPRGFGFITYDSEDAVDKVLQRTFHELNGKMVEVKRAVPKELSPSPVLRSPVLNYTPGMNRMSSFLSSYTSSTRPYGIRLDGSFVPISSPRNGNFPTSAPGGYGRSSLDQSSTLNYNDSMNYGSIPNFGRGISPYIGGNSNRLSCFVPIGTGSSRVDSSFSSPMTRNMWGNGGQNYNATSTLSNDFLGSAGGRLGGGFGNNVMRWDSSSQSARGASAGYGVIGLNINNELHNFGSENEYGTTGSSYGRSSQAGRVRISYPSMNTPYEGAYSDLYGGTTGDSTWRHVSSELDGSNPFDYGMGTAPSSNAADNGSGSYIGGYSNVISRLNGEN